MDSIDELQDAETDNREPLDWLLPELPTQYEIFGQVTGGAMGSVFKAQNRYTGAHVAIKIMRSEAAQNTVAIQRFFLEAKAASLLKHSNICRLLDFGVSKSGMPYLVMDWIDGISLERMIAESKGLSMSEALPIFKQAALALAHAHQKKIIHRDLKPENIMINKSHDGQLEIQLIDFGIAKMLAGTKNSMQINAVTRVGVTVGTPAYMSPEQARGEIVDKRSDIYSLGCVMYFAISGKVPFMGETTRQVMEKHIYELPADIDSTLNIPSAMKTIIFKAMSKDPAQRYATMDDLVIDLDKLLYPVPSVNEPLKIKSRPVKGKLGWVFWFLIGFFLVYTIVVILQYVVDASDSAPRKKTEPIRQPMPVQSHAPET